MAGCLPTKTTIRIKSSTGDHTDVQGATRAQAGVMTADHVARLEAVEATLHAGGDGVVILPPTPLVPQRPPVSIPVDAVTRAEMRQALGQLKTDVLNDVGRVLQAVRQEIPAGNIESIDHARIERLEMAVLGLSDRVDKVESTLSEISVAIQEAAAEARRESAA